MNRRILYMFADWVASEVCKEDFSDNAEFFAEVACRKLEKIGIIKSDNNKWIYENTRGEFDYGKNSSN